MTDNHSDEWFELSHRALKLRDYLREINSDKKIMNEQKRDLVRKVRKEVFEMLFHETDVPHPLKMLIGDLLGGKLVDYWPDGKFELAIIESKQDGSVGKKRLATLFNLETGRAIDPKKIGRWRDDEEYKDFVKDRRADEGGSNGA